MTDEQDPRPEEPETAPVEPAAAAAPGASPASTAPAGPLERTVPGDEGEIPGDPAAPLPSVDELGAAMQTAFEGEEIPPALVERFARHARLLLETNRELNLTAITDPKEVALKHYLDSWRLIRFMALIGRTVLDLGSGAGFPGLPIAMAEPDARVTLCDATRKRVAFLERSIRELEVKNASAVWERAEDHLARQSYDVVLVRAVSSVRENVRLLRKVRHAFKDYVMYKAASWSREARAAEREAERLGFRLETVWEHELPHGAGQRAILLFKAPGAQGH